MSEMDEITQHAGRFSAQLTQALGQLSQAATWLERRALRKNIRKMVTDEQKQRERIRQAELAGMTRALENYRMHSVSTTARAANPDVAPQQRERDRAAMVRHHNDLEERILRSSDLTTIEQGIALDGMAAATTFPEYRLGNVFARTRRVKGVEALRYRAQVARAQAAAGIQRRPAYVAPPQRQARAGKYTTEQVDAIQAIRRSHSTDHWGPLPQHRTETREYAAQMAAEAGLSPDQITREFNQAGLNSQVAVQINGRALNGSSAAYIGLHPNEHEAADWARENFADYVEDMRDTIGDPHEASVSATDRASSDALFYTRGPLGFVADEVTSWRTAMTRPSAYRASPDRVAGTPREHEATRTRQPSTARSAGDLPRREFAERTPVTDAARERGTAPAAAVGRDEPGEYIVRVEVGDGSEPENPIVGWRNAAVSEQDAAEWAHFRVDTLHPDESGHVEVSVDRERGDGHLDPVFASSGRRQSVQAEVTDWHLDTVERAHRDTTARETDLPRRGVAEHSEDTTRHLEREVSESDHVSAPDARLVELERQVRDLKGVVGERDQLARKVAMLGRGVDAITADRDEHKRQAEDARAEVQTLKNVTTRQDAELKDLRAQSLRLVEVTAEKNRLKSERDEAVAKVRSQAGRQQYNGSAAGASRQASPVEAGEQMQRAFNDRVRREFPGAADEVIERARRQQEDMIGAIDDADSSVMRNKVAQLWQEHGAEATPEYAQAFQEWWSRGGDLEYAKERDRRERQRRNPAAGNGENTQEHRRETFSAPAESNGNGQQRPGRGPIERSR